MNPGLGYSAKCRACNSLHRVEIDTRLLSGESARSVATWLEATHGEKIPHQGLSNHRSEHLDAHGEAVVRIEAAAQVAATGPVFETAVLKVVADAAVLNEVAEIALETARDLAKQVRAGKFAQPVATAFAAALANARGAVTDRHELLYGKKLNVESNTPASAAPEADALHARLAILAARPAPGDDPGAAGGAPPD